MKHIVIFLMIISFPVSAEIYKWTDKNGNVYFGDSPNITDKPEKITIEVNSYKNVTFDNVDFYQGAASKRVTMFATSWCAYCKKARRYFKKNGISYAEYDIEKDKKAKRKYDLLGAKGVPVILVGKKRMNGFSVSGFERIYK